MTISIDNYLPDYLKETSEDVLKRAISNAPSNINTMEGDIFWNSVKPFSEEIAKFRRVSLLQILKLGITQTATGKFLDLKGEAEGIPRKKGSAAIHKIKISAKEGTRISAGRVVCTTRTEDQAAIEFLVQNTAIVDDSEIAIIEVECTEIGTIGNVAIGNINMFSQNINGIISIENIEIIKFGVDDELDGDYLERILENASNTPSSANDAHYEKWAKECTGVSECKVIPQWDGDGTVKIIIVADGHKAATKELVNEVNNYIDPYPKMGKGQAPIGAELTVVSCIEKAINIKVKLQLSDGYILNICKEKFGVMLDTELKEMPFKTTKYISIAQLGRLILDIPGVIDYTDLYLNESVSNCILAEDEIAVKGILELEAI